MLPCLWALLAAAASASAPVDLSTARARGSTARLDPGWLPAGFIVDHDPAGLVRTGLDASDDLAFLSLVGADDRSKVLAATITYGNALLAHTKADAYLLHRLAGVVDTIPRAAGIADWTGRPSLSSKSPASELIAEKVFREPPGTVVVVCLGPLHNLASAFVQYPRLAGRLRAVVISEGVRGLGGVDVNLAGGDREATRVVLAASVPRVLVPWRVCARAPLTPALYAAVRSLCPGPAACEYLPQLRRAAERSDGRRGWGRDAWDTVFRDGAEEEQEAAKEAAEAAWEAATGAGGGAPERGAAGRLRAARERRAGVMCDLVAMSAALAPDGFREWDVKLAELDGWGALEEGTLRAGFTAEQAQALLATARGGVRTDPPPEFVPFDWKPPAPPCNETAAELLPGMSLTDPGVVLVPNRPRHVRAGSPPARHAVPMVRALALAFFVPHGEPWHQMTGAFVDDGMLNPFIFWPLAAVAAGTAVTCGAMVWCCLRIMGPRGELLQKKQQ